MLTNTDAAKKIKCGECGSPMVLKQSMYGSFFSCSTWPKCKGKHGAHPDGTPLGIPANKKTRNARIRAHAAFDQLWNTGTMSRKEAYAWLEQNVPTGMPFHIGSMSVEDCDVVISLVEQWVASQPPRKA